MFVRSGAQTAAVTAATSVSVPFPTTLVAGDLLVMAVVVGGAPTVTDPSGWSPVTAINQSGANLTVRVYTRVADGTETGTVSVSWSSAQNAVGAMVTSQYGFASGATVTLDPTPSKGSATGTSFLVNGNTVQGTQQVGSFAVIASINNVGVDSWSGASAAWSRQVLASVASPYITMMILASGETGPLSNLPQYFAASTQTNTQTYYALFGVRVPDPATYSGPSIFIGNTENKSPEYTYVSSTASQPVLAPANIEYVRASGSWPPSGQGWPRIKQS